MGEASRYWKLVRIDAGGNRKIQEIPAARSFYAQVFERLAQDDDVPDGEIQRQLLHLYRHSSGETALLAERCLLCFLSWILEQGCMQLERKFGKNHNFSCSDLLPYVLDDDGKLSATASYKCFSRQIIQSFDAQQSNLTTWALMKVKQHPELNKFLGESGVYLISDWAILNDTQPKQLERILKEFHLFSDSAIQEAQCLLQSYHTVYRLQRLQQIRRKVRSKCTEPTTQQLQDIAQLVKTDTGRLFDDVTVRKMLNKLATQLGWILESDNEYMETARGEARFNLYQGTVLLDQVPNLLSLVVQRLHWFMANVKTVVSYGKIVLSRNLHVCNLPKL